MTRIAGLSVLRFALGGVLTVAAGVGVAGCAGTGDHRLPKDKYTGERMPASVYEANAWGYPHADASAKTPPNDAVR